MYHNERCKECKIRVRQLLEKIYGTVIPNHRIYLETRPEEMLNHPHYTVLNNIYTTLQNHRGFSDFVRASYVDVDFFLPEHKMIVEFDESQHFTEPRKITLSQYPTNLTLGFSADTWLKHCDEILAHDNDPPFRDEQRAWYDTLRDFLPEIKGYKPTIRIFARDLDWCSLDRDNKSSIQKFLNYIQYLPDINKDKKIDRISQMSQEDWIATVILQSNLEYVDEKTPSTNQIRILELEKIIQLTLQKNCGDGVILFPGGWVHTQYERAEVVFPEIEKCVQKILQQYDRNIKVCVGVDGYFDCPIDKNPYDQDQLAVTIDKTGIISIARKFYPVTEERTKIILADNHKDGEFGKPRVFELNGVRFFPFVCYDVYGPHHETQISSNPDVDIGLNLIHRYYPKKEKLSQENYFPLCGWSEASCQWKIPIFGTSIFFRRSIPPNWPTGIIWTGGDVWEKLKYLDISLPYKIPVEKISLPEGMAEIRFFIDVSRIVQTKKELGCLISKNTSNNSQIQRFKQNQRDSAIINQNKMYDLLKGKLDPVFGKSIMDQKNQYTYRVENKIGYPQKMELDMILLFKPKGQKNNGVRVRIYHYTLMNYLGIHDVDELIKNTPNNFEIDKGGNNSHPGDLFIQGVFSEENEVNQFIEWIKNVMSSPSENPLPLQPTHP